MEHRSFLDRPFWEKETEEMTVAQGLPTAYWIPVIIIMAAAPIIILLTSKAQSGPCSDKALLGEFLVLHQKDSVTLSLIPE